MAVSLKHAFHSDKPDGNDTSQVQASDWNAEHELILPTGTVLGRTTDGTGEAEAIPLAELGGATPLFADLGTSTISSAVVALQTSGYSVSGKGAGLYVNDSFADVTLAAAHPIFCKADAGGRYWRLDVSHWLNIFQAGAVGDDDAWPTAVGTPTDDGPAFVAALAYLRMMEVNMIPGARTLFVPRANYWLNTSTLDLTFTVTITGVVGDVNANQTGNYGSRLRWADGYTGIRTQTYGTTGAEDEDASPADLYYFNNGLIENLYLWGGSYSSLAESESHGIHLRGVTRVRNNTIRQFGGDGIYAYASTTDSGVPGNCNGSIIENNKLIYCRNGMHFKGADVNSMQFRDNWFFLNHRYGRWHEKGVDNVITGDLYESNGRQYTLYSTTCHYGGSWYYCLPDQEVGAAANHPKGNVVTMTIASPCVMTWTAHGLAVGDVVSLNTTGALPTGLVIETRYYVVSVPTADTFTVSATVGGAAINTTGSQSGVHTLGVAAISPYGAAGNNTYWGYLDTGNGGLDVPTWSNGMAIKSGGIARFDGAGQNGIISGYTEDNQGPAQFEAQYLVQGGMASAAVDFEGTPWSGGNYVEGDQFIMAYNAKVNNNLVVSGQATVGSATKTSSTSLYLSTNTGTDCILYGNFASTAKLPYYGMSSNGDLTLSSDGGIGYLYRNGTGYIAKWTSAGFLPGTDATYDLGAAATQWKTGFFSSYVKTAGMTVASLPAAATAGAGARAFVTDANATTFASTVAGGGANGVPVFSDGTNWKIG